MTDSKCVHQQIASIYSTTPNENNANVLLSAINVLAKRYFPLCDGRMYMPSPEKTTKTTRRLFPGKSHDRNKRDMEDENS